jgi:ABC-2 type transport system ATP-binding protein
LHDPRLLILDEPINGLDPAGIVEIREYLRSRVTDQDTTIFLSSHILSEISKIATRIGIVHQGRLIKEINTDLLDNLLIKRIQVNTSDNTKALEVLIEHEFPFTSNGSGILESTSEKALISPEAISEILVNAGLPLKMLHIIEEDLESYFLRIIGH